MKTVISVPFFFFFSFVSAFAVYCPFVEGKSYKWDTGISAGTMTITNVSGDSFEIAQKNDKNKKAGTVKMYGSFKDDGTCVITNKSYSEIWNGKFSDGKISGKVNSSFNFVISGVFAEKKSGDSFEKIESPFLEKGKVAYWDTGISHGTMTVVKVDGSKFTIEQTNDTNTKAGTIVMDGEIQSDGKCTIINKKYRETWVGTYVDNEIKGRVNKSHNFVIRFTKPVPVEEKIESPFLEKGKVAYWDTGISHGTMTVVKVDGSKFTIEQTNDTNTKAGTIVMDGEIQSDGKCTIVNKKYRETWVGTYVDNEIKGRVNKTYNFVIRFTKPISKKNK